MTTRKFLLGLLIALNLLVLLGQLWPDGAPPFARIMNILFLLGSLIWFLEAIRKMK